MAIPLSSPAVDTGDPATPLGTTSVRPASADRRRRHRRLRGVPADTFPPIASPTRPPSPTGSAGTTTDVTVSWNWAQRRRFRHRPCGNCTLTSISSGEGNGDPAERHVRRPRRQRGLGVDDGRGRQDRAHSDLRGDADLRHRRRATPPTSPRAVTDGLSGPVATAVSGGRHRVRRATPGMKTKSLTGSTGPATRPRSRAPYVVSLRVPRVPRTDPADVVPRRVEDPDEVQSRRRLRYSRSRMRQRRPSCPGLPGAVTLDGTEQGCARYDARSNLFQVDVKTDRAISAGDHTIGIKVAAADGSGIVNNQTTSVTIR